MEEVLAANTAAGVSHVLFTAALHAAPPQKRLAFLYNPRLSLTTGNRYGHRQFMASGQADAVTVS